MNRDTNYYRVILRSDLRLLIAGAILIALISCAGGYKIRSWQAQNEQKIMRTMEASFCEIQNAQDANKNTLIWYLNEITGKQKELQRCMNSLAKKTPHHLYNLHLK